ncbi:hypothetical protein [Sphingobacterium sp. BN32]|uniref:hypothetical protein n=1 Tax=Sphingobacterium sp. BN32 TaxID=3058432 RepID=UPI00265D2B27|nr:hypothetical protein [Sphingobacterium sp. BN32]WKK58302.1 hypothetical protein QYC40_16855 [Sphingobacterium sp. BN32]
MIISSERFLKRLDISSDVDILEKLNNYADYFKGRSKVRVITTGKVVFGGNTRHDILTQLRMDLVNYFRGQKTTDIFDRIDKILEINSITDKVEIVQVIINIEQDIKLGYTNHHYTG